MLRMYRVHLIKSLKSMQWLENTSNMSLFTYLTLLMLFIFVGTMHFSCSITRYYNNNKLLVFLYNHLLLVSGSNPYRVDQLSLLTFRPPPRFFTFASIKWEELSLQI